MVIYISTTRGQLWVFLETKLWSAILPGHCPKIKPSIIITILICNDRVIVHTVIASKKLNLFATCARVSKCVSSRHRNAICIPRCQSQHICTHAVIRRVSRCVQRYSKAFHVPVRDVIPMDIAVPWSLPADGGTRRCDIDGMNATWRWKRNIILARALFIQWICMH